MTDPYLTLQDGLADLTSTRAAGLTRRWSYFKGNQPRVWVTDKFARLFRDLADSMGDNYCGLAVNSRVSRLKVEGWSGPDAEAAEGAWADGGWPIRQSSFYQWGLGYGQVYLIGEEGETGPVLQPNRPTLVSHTASQDNPLMVETATKAWWSRGEWHAVVYDDADVWRFVAPGKAETMPKFDQFRPDPEDEGGPHGFDRCPVIVCYPYGFDSPVLLDTVRGAQDRINKIGSNKFVASEFSAFAQRVFFTRQDIQDEDVVNAPDHAIVLDPGDAEGKASVQELSGGDLAKFDAAKQAEVDTFFTLALLPRHLMVNPGAAPSGAAIKADEGPMVAAVREHQAQFGESMSAGWDLFGWEAESVWENPEVADGLDTAQEVRAYVDSGVPVDAALVRVAGWTQEDVDEMRGTVTEAAPTGPTVVPDLLDGLGA